MAVGTGVMLIDLRVLIKCRSLGFYYMERRIKRLYRRRLGFFCEKAQSLGIPVYVDMSLSKEIGHVGSFEFKHTHVEIPLKE